MVRMPDEDINDPEDGEDTSVERDSNDEIAAIEWWCSAHGNILIWARLATLASGIAEVFDCDGRVLRYDDDVAARTALMDAEFRAFDGIDDDDAAMMGIDLDTTEPPHSDSEAELREQMVQKIAGVD
ncbi:MAG: hypothetical protein ABI451_04080 [Dokdonella sp.]